MQLVLQCWANEANEVSIKFSSDLLLFLPQIVVSKLREKTAMDHDRKHWKAAKVRQKYSSIKSFIECWDEQFYFELTVEILD